MSATVVPAGRSTAERLAYVLSKLGRVAPAVNAAWHLRGATRRGLRVTLCGRAKIVNHGTLLVGDHVHLDSTLGRLELVVLEGGCLEIGNNIFINCGTSIVASAHVRIGNGCLIGRDVMVMDCDFHRVADKTWDTTGSPIVLEDRVWLGNRVIVLKGVTIGHDAVVGAGAVVTRDVPPRTIVAGNPARAVRQF